MKKRYVLQQITDRCGRVFFALDDEDEENPREEYFDQLEDAEKRLAELQKHGVFSTITEIEVD
jgi:hypothetical protein